MIVLLFFSKAKDGVKILVDEDELAREKEAKVAEFARWNKARAEMKKRREDELAARNLEKIKQIQDYEALQVSPFLRLSCTQPCFIIQ